MGRVSAPFGVKGWVKIRPFTENTDSLFRYPSWLLGGSGAWKEHLVEDKAVHGDVLVVRFAEVHDRAQAMKLKAREVGVLREHFPAPAEGEYYWTDLVGLKVENTKGQLLGQVERLFESGANPVVVVKGERERLLPFVDAVVKSVDLRAGRLLVDWELDY